jgi:hypothetical protein
LLVKKSTIALPMAKIGAAIEDVCTMYLLHK